MFEPFDDPTCPICKIKLIHNGKQYECTKCGLLLLY